MTCFIMPNWLFYVFVTLAALGLLWSIIFIVFGIYLHVKEKKEKKEEEKAFFAPVECKDEDELIRMQALFPGKYPAEDLLLIKCGCEGMLDGCRAAEDELLSKVYEYAQRAYSEEREERYLEHLTEAYGAEVFISFMQDHGINAYLTYLQNGEIFFEDKPNE